jgi:hypothetical protein
MEYLPNLTIEFLEDAAEGLRLVSHSNWSVECLVSSRVTLPGSFRQENSFKWLDAPGVYILTGPPEVVADGSPQSDAQLYVGQADSVAERLDSHLKSEKKRWWRTAVVLRRTEKNPLNADNLITKQLGTGLGSITPVWRTPEPSRNSHYACKD